jgi:hypothetical protein
VRVEIRPVTTAVMAAAQAAASRRLGAIRIADPDLDPDMPSPPGRASATPPVRHCRSRRRRSSA